MTGRHRIVLCLLVTAGCGGSVTAPNATSNLITGSGAESFYLSTPPTSGAYAARKRTRLVLNSDGKVIGIAYLDLSGLRYDVTFSPGGLSYNEALASLGRRVDPFRFATSTEAVAAVDAIRNFFNNAQPPVTADDVGWDSLNDADSRGDVVVAYGVTSTEVPYAYTGWNAVERAWLFSGTFTFERDQELTSAATWAFFTAAKGGGSRLQ